MSDWRTDRLARICWLIIPGCWLQVPQQVVREVASAQQLARLQNYALRSFVEDSRTLTWCPAPGTQYV